jgi:hypothetical protein
MSQLAEIRTQFGEGIGVELFYKFPDISQNQRTYLDADAASGVSSLSANGINFAVGQYVVIGNPGNVRTEILQVHTSTVPSASTITLVGATQFPHSRGDIIRFIPYNQLVVEKSVDGGVTYVAQSAVAIRADSSETYQQFASDLSTYYYKFRFYNATTTLYSAYSDPTIATGFGDNTIFSVKERALNELGEERTSLISDKFLNAQIYAARRALDQSPGILRWSFRRKDDQQIGQAIAGTWRVAAPIDLRDRNSHKNILMLRIGRQNYPVIYQDDQRFKQNYLNVAHTTLSVAASFGATTLTLTSAADLDATGTIKVAGSGVGVDMATITYTSVNRSTGVISGVTGVPIAGLAANSDVWQGATFGLPRGYGIVDGYLYFDVPFAYQYDGQSIKMDYYNSMTAISTDSQTFDEPFYDLFVSWLKWKSAYLKSNGKVSRDSNTDYKDWTEGVARVISQEVPGQRISFIPDISGFLSATE